MERMNFLGSAEYELGDRLTGYGEFRMSRNVTESPQRRGTGDLQHHGRSKPC